MKLLISILCLFIVACTSTKQDENTFRSDCGYFELQGDKPLTFSVINQQQVGLDGVICSGSLDAFEEMYSQFPAIKQLNIDIIEGSADDETNLVLSQRIHDLKLSTHLNENGLIASGGVDLFLAGVIRTTSDKKPKVGVHSWGSSDGTNGNELSKAAEEHQPYLNYYKSINIDVNFYWFTLSAAPADNIYWMKNKDLETYSIFTQ